MLPLGEKVKNDDGYTNKHSNSPYIGRPYTIERINSTVDFPDGGLVLCWNIIFKFQIVYKKRFSFKL